MKKTGFTLVEILVTIGILGIIVVVASNLFFSLLKGSMKTKTLQTVKQNGTYAISVMERMIRNARGIETCTSAMKKIKITNPDMRTTEFDLTGPQIASNSGNFLTSNEVKVESSKVNQFDCVPGNGKPAVVTIQFSLSQAALANRPEEEASVTFQTTVSLRNY